MAISLDQIISNPELAKSVSTEWIQGELQKQPYNRFLQGLLDERSQKSTGFSHLDPESLINSIIADNKPSNPSSYFIRDIELTAEDTFAEAKTSSNKAAIITGAVLGTGAIMAKDATDGNKIDVEAKQEQGGLLGFLNRLDDVVSPKASTPEMDPMLKKENYEKPIAEDAEFLDVTDDITEEIIEEVESDDVIENEQSETSAIPEQIPTLEENNSLDEEEDYSAEMIVVDNLDKKKKKKGKKNKYKSKYRWSSQTNADYTMEGLDPFTDWINSIDGVEITPVESKPEKKKKKKKQHFKSLESKPEIASEALAVLLTNQGHYEDAIAMYQQLSLKNPEKSSFFAAKIESIKDKI